MLDHYHIPVRRACTLARLSRTAWYRRSGAKDQPALRVRIREIAASRPRFGYKRIWVMLRRQGWMINHKRVHRLYRLDGLQLRSRVRRRMHMSLHRGVVPKATARHEWLRMDFVQDQMFDGRRFRKLPRQVDSSKVEFPAYLVA